LSENKKMENKKMKMRSLQLQGLLLWTTWTAITTFHHNKAMIMISTVPPKVMDNSDEKGKDWIN